jgi:adenylate cyclase
LAIFLGVALAWAGLWRLAERSGAEGWLSPLRRVEWMTQDAILRRSAPASKEDRLVFLGVDQPNYDGRFLPDELAGAPGAALLASDYPWSREVWAILLDKLVAAGARTVVFDLLFISPGRGDEVFSAALKRHEDKVVLAANLNFPVDADTPSPIYPADSLLDALEDPLAVVGFVNFLPDADSVIRRARPDFVLLQDTYSTLAARMAAALGRPVTGGEPWRFRFGGPAGTYAHIPVWQAFSPAAWRDNLKDGAVFKDKIVLIGPAATWTQDLHRTAAAEVMFGPEVHLHAAAEMARGGRIVEPSAGWVTAIILGVGLLAGLVFCLVEHPWWRVVLLSLGNAGGLALAFGVYSRWGLMPVLLPPLLVLNSGGALCLVQKFFSTFLEKLRTRAMLERYVSQNFVREVLDRSSNFEESLGGVRRRCTMLFSDIRGFTTMTEGADSHALVTQLNEYLGEMVECVFRHEGTLDKFIGDAVMAVWGNVQVREERADAVGAVRCALEMLAALERLNVSWKARGIAELHIGVGLNHGEVIVGNMGSPRRKEFTVIGDAVNLASRLEGVTKEYGLALVIGESVAELVREDFVLQAVDLIRVKGKTKPVAIFTVRRARTPALAAYEAALHDYRAGRFAEAREGFAAAQSAHAPGEEADPLPTLYRKRCDAMLAEPPAPAWDGVFVMKTK